MRPVTRQRLMLWALIPTAVAAYFFCVGCSSTRKIAETATAARIEITDTTIRIEEQATLTLSALDILEGGGEVTPDLILSMRTAQAGILADATHIRLTITEATDSILHDLTGTEDQTSPWATTILWAAIALTTLAILFILWRSGALGFMGRLVGLGTALLPAPLARRENAAELAVKTCDPNDPCEAPELIASLRASDPAFDRAYRRAKSKAPPTRKDSK